MMGGPGRFGNMLNQETLKPRKLSETLLRLGGYFGRFGLAAFLAILFVVISTWTQVTTPELIGQATDCFLVPLGANSSFGSFSAAISPEAQASAASCWLVSDPAKLSGTQWIIASAYRLGGFVPPALATMTNDDRVAGLGRLILIVIALFVMGSVLTGLTFFTMSWSGQHVLRALRVDVFERLHQLSMSYYAVNEAGDLMSRITNDTSAIEQAVSFALVNVFSGILLLIWVAYNMFTSSVPFALLSLAVSPIMFLATLYFSDQARKAFRKTRTEIGNVNAELQESIAAVREVQAFNRADENIENFKGGQCRQPRCQRPRRSIHLGALAYVGSARLYSACHRHRRGRLVYAQRADHAGHRCDFRLDRNLPGLCPALQPADPTDRRIYGATSRMPLQVPNASSACSTKCPPCRINLVPRSWPRLSAKWNSITSHMNTKMACRC